MATLSDLKSFSSTATGVIRIEIRAKPNQIDPRAEVVWQRAREHLGLVKSVQTARVYLVEADLDNQTASQIANELLADPVTQVAMIGVSEAPHDGVVIEIHYRSGVMDPVAQSTRDAIEEMLSNQGTRPIEVRTGFRYDLIGTRASPKELEAFACAVLANPAIQQIHLQPFLPQRFPHGSDYTFQLIRIPIRELNDEGLIRLSRQSHLFLSHDEMHSIQDYYKSAGRDPTDIELETLAQTWSEHCVHKTLKAAIRYRDGSSVPGAPRGVDWRNRPGHTVNDDGSVTIDNLLKSTIAAATQKLMQRPPHDEWCVSVFIDNAGIVRFDDEDAVCIKVETHNHPSSIEPYGGAATGIGGCIRDVMGTGLAASPVANSDVFCVAYPDLQANDGQSIELPKGVIHPRRTLDQVVAGVRDYGNRMGIPTVNGAVYFHEHYLANPLVFVGCVGLIPLDKCAGDPQTDDRIIVLGGRTGRDGIHGATFSSAELTDTHADEFIQAVQIGNAITQKKMLDVIIAARDIPVEQGGCLFNAITDCGAGGFSSAVGEMGELLGARVTLETAPLKYIGLSYTEIWISEAQERMVLAVPASKVHQLRTMCEAEDVEMCDLGHFGAADTDGKPELVLTHGGMEVGRLSMSLLHEGCPRPIRQAVWGRLSENDDQAEKQRVTTVRETGGKQSIDSILTLLLSHPNIASKHWIIRQYDHEVQGGSVVKPLVGPCQDGPSDAAVLRPKLDSERGIAIACGLQPALGDPVLSADADTYWMTLAAIDEAVRNCVCVGADPNAICLLDNFCWPSCEEPEQLGALVRAAEACYDGSLAYRTPFISGKDSLNNQFTKDDGSVIAIPATLLITAMGIVPDVSYCCTMDAKAAENVLLMVGHTTSSLGGSHYLMLNCAAADRTVPKVDLQRGPICANAVAKLIRHGLVRSAHDCSDGGMLVAAVEMAFAGRVGVDLDFHELLSRYTLDMISACFAETPSRYLLEVSPSDLDNVKDQLQKVNVPVTRIGCFSQQERVTFQTDCDGPRLDLSLADLHAAWRKPLDW